jgi:hypothetical protein
MLYLNKTHYGALRESISATDEIGQHLTQIELARLTALAWREAEVMTFNNLFQIIAIIFFSAVLLAPLLKKEKKVGNKKYFFPMQCYRWGIYQCKAFQTPCSLKCRQISP